MASAVGAAAALIQRAYEGGRISYPRTEAVDLDAEVARGIESVAQSRGLAWTNPAPRQPGGAHRQAHEALCPLSPAGLIPTSEPLAVLEPPDQVAFRVLRALLRAGSARSVEVAAGDASDPAWAAALQWWRPAESVPGWLRRPIEAEDLRPALVLYGPDEIALRALMDAGLGKPSTLAAHAERAAEHGFVGESGLTPAGRSCLAAAPPVLAEPATCRRIESDLEAACEAGREADEAVWEVLGSVPTLLPRVRAALTEASGETDAAASIAITPAVDDDSTAWRRRARRRWATSGAEQSPPTSDDATVSAAADGDRAKTPDDYYPYPSLER